MIARKTLFQLKRNGKNRLNRKEIEMFIFSLLFPLTVNFKFVDYFSKFNCYSLLQEFEIYLLLVGNQVIINNSTCYLI